MQIKCSQEAIPALKLSNACWGFLSEECVSEVSGEKIDFQIFQWFFRLKNLKREYLAKTPLEKWRYICGINAGLGKIIGCDYVALNYKLSWRSFVPVPILLDYFISCLYTMYSFRDDPVRSLMSTPVIAIIIPVCCFTLFIQFSKRLKRYFDFNYS